MAVIAYLSTFTPTSQQKRCPGFLLLLTIDGNSTDQNIKHLPEEWLRQFSKDALKRFWHVIK